MTATDTYKSTPWLRGASPWPLMPIKYLLAQPITDGPHETPEFLDTGYPFLSVDGIQDGELVFEGCRFVSEDQHREFRRKAAPRRGDVLFGKAASTGKIARVKTDVEFSIWSPLALLRPSETKVTSAFLEYALKSQIAQGQIDVLVTTNTQNNISMDAIPRIRIPLPVLQQQRAIADYLVRETARLDALVAAKERVLGLLTEKRRALITRAVTRGRDPRAPLRDSGIPWLGEIPAHWERAQLRRFMQFITSGSRGWAEHYSDTGSLFVRIGNLTRDAIGLDLSDVQYVAPPVGTEGERTKIQPGDLLFSITAYLGSIAVAPVGLEDAYVNQHIALVRLDEAKGLTHRFAAYVALSDIGQSQLAGQGYGGTKTQLALDDIKDLWFPVPPATEQQAIVSRIEREVVRVDAIRAATVRTVDLLKERRAALIAAAVTGQLEVA